MPVKQMSLEEQAHAAIDASMMGTEKPKKTWAANLVSAASMTPRAISWVWPSWMAQGKLHILAGAAGTGKTTLALGLIATLTSAGRWPDGERCIKPGNAILWSSEDDPEDTIIPRLIAMGADLNRVHILQGRISDAGEAEPFDPSTDMPLLRDAAERIGGVDLLMLDPIVSAISGDMHKANDVRRGLQAVVDFASEQGAAILGISHFSKGSAGSSPQDRVIGSQAFSALARVVLVAAKQEDGETRVLARAKSNITVDEGGVSYTIEPYNIDGGIETTRVMWGDRIEGSARDILGEVEAVQDGASDDPGSDAEDALQRVLKDGPVTGKQAKQTMLSSGFTEKQIRRARERLQVVTARDGFGADMKTYWSLKRDGESPFVPSDSHSCPVNTVGTNEEKGHECENVKSPKVLIDWSKVLNPGTEHLSENLSTLDSDERVEPTSDYARVRG